MSDHAETVLGPESVFKGELRATGVCRILGAFEGSIRGAGDVHVASNGICAATIEADRVVIDGSHTGDIVARERLQLGPKAQVRGDVVAGAISVAEGATFLGRVGVGPEAVAQARPMAAASSQPLPEIKIVNPKTPGKVEWANEPAPPGDWMSQPLKAPTWMKGSEG
ncbi:hypothetical protein PHYC_02481 [Phycisphaerales bacterium]|nr:hypothetical protein PHYC_02481 [Phycisphaerales bacterium]